VWVGENIYTEGHLVLIDFIGSLVGGELAPDDDADDARWVSLDEIHQYPLTLTMDDLIETLKERGEWPRR
jgi:ADP-ribose pyrophosphatase YjhB (NUDIX family)